MRVYHYAILFSIIAIIFVTIRDVSYAQVSLAGEEKRQYEKKFSCAVDSAVNVLTPDKEGCIISTGEAAYTSLLNSLYTAFDLSMDCEGRQRLELFLPIVAIADEDGLYMYYYDEGSINGTHLERVWSERIPYSAIYEDKLYEFTISGKAIYYDEERNKIVEHQLSTGLESLRKDAISSTIEQNVTKYINQHNLIAKQYGVQYDFQVPIEDNSINSRAITNPSLLVLFQGYPLVGTNQVYQCFAFAGASLYKHHWYVISKKDWYYIYHRQDCETLKQLESESEESSEIICHTKKECAAYGAYPCPDCMDLMGDYFYLEE